VRKIGTDTYFKRQTEEERERGKIGVCPYFAMKNHYTKFGNIL